MLLLPLLAFGLSLRAREAKLYVVLQNYFALAFPLRWRFT